MDKLLCVKKVANIFHYCASFLTHLYNAQLFCFRGKYIPPHLDIARVVKLVDTTDLKSVATVKSAYRFDSGSGHQHKFFTPSKIITANQSVVVFHTFNF